MQGGPETTGTCLCFACVPQDKAVVIEQFGKFKRVVRGGFAPILCCLGECATGSLSMRVDQLDVMCETKTKDNVFVHVMVSVQYEVEQDKMYEAFYKLTNPRSQITAYVFDVIRSQVPRINLDDVFDQKDTLAGAVKEELSKTMPAYGFKILQSLVTDITPDARVKAAMNEINAAQRIRIAATDKAEAEKILVVKAAEADMESKYLSGVGISRQRQAIVAGLQESVVAFTNNVNEINARDVLELMLMTQYFDMMKDIGGSSSTVFVPHNPAAVANTGAEIRNSFLQARAAHITPNAPAGQGAMARA